MERRAPAPVPRRRLARRSRGRQPAAGRADATCWVTRRRARRGRPAAGRLRPGAAAVPEPLDIVAEVGSTRRARTVRRSAARARSPSPRGVVASASCRPSRPRVAEAVEAVDDADLVVLGPGSWFTSVLPHLLVPELAARAARHRRPAGPRAEHRRRAGGDRRLLARRRTSRCCCSYAPDLRVDVVLANQGTVGDACVPGRSPQAARTLGAELVLAPVAVDDGSPRHDPGRLAGAFREVLSARSRTSAEHPGRAQDLATYPHTGSTEGHPAWQ